MKFYVEDFFSPKDVELFREIRALVEKLPDALDLGCDQSGGEIILSCHILSHAIYKVLDCREFQVVDGRFANGHMHSWLANPQNDIIDVYPVGTLGGPIMICGNKSVHTREVYFPSDEKGKQQYQKFFRDTKLEESVRVVSTCLTLIQKAG